MADCRRFHYSRFDTPLCRLLDSPVYRKTRAHPRAGPSGPIRTFSFSFDFGLNTGPLPPGVCRSHDHSGKPKASSREVWRERDWLANYFSWIRYPLSHLHRWTDRLTWPYCSSALSIRGQIKCGRGTTIGKCPEMIWKLCSKSIPAHLRSFNGKFIL